MKKYLTRWQEIELAEVERESESCVWIKGRRVMKRTDFECYHDTEEEARSYLIAKAEAEVRRALSQLRYAEEKLAKAKHATVKHK